jgi:aspartate ammonia-lyase
MTAFGTEREPLGADADGTVEPVIPGDGQPDCYAVAGADVSITMAAQNGQLQLNAF